MFMRLFVNVTASTLVVVLLLLVARELAEFVEQHGGITELAVELLDASQPECAR